MLRFLTCLALAVALASIGARPAHAESDTIALLPFDSVAKLEIYGQPVASELARVLTDGKIDVVLVDRKMAVPERARLIVDGTIASGKGTAIVLTVRVRTTADGTVLATMDATAPTLANIDRAAAEVSAKVLAKVRLLLVEQKPTVVGTPIASLPPTVPVTPKLRPMLVAFSAKDANAERLRTSLTTAVGTWAHKHLREPMPIAPDKLTKKAATPTVKASGNDLAIGFEIVAFSIRPGVIPLARARVRVRISDAVGIVFDRVIATDTVVGDKGLTVDQLAQRTAFEVVDIMRPHVKRTVAGWR